MFYDNYEAGEGCIYSERGFRFGYVEESLIKHFGKFLKEKSLNELIGEAVCWLSLPANVSIFSLPILFFFFPTFIALLVSVLILFVFQVLISLFYSKAVNTLSYIFSIKIVRILYVGIWVAVLVILNMWVDTLVFLLTSLGFQAYIRLIIPINYFLGMIGKMEFQDRVLSLVARHYKFPLEPSGVK